MSNRGLRLVITKRGIFSHSPIPYGDVSNAVLVAGTSGNCESQLKEEIEARSNRQRKKQSVQPEVGNRQPENVRDPDRSYRHRSI
jgi:hypothetical protein